MNIYIFAIIINVAFNQGITFGILTMHLFVGVIFCMAGTYVLVRFLLFRNKQVFQILEHSEITELKREIKAWQHSVLTMSTPYTAEEDVVKKTINRKIIHLEQRLNRKLHLETLSKDVYMITLLDLQKRVLFDFTRILSNIISFLFLVFYSRQSSFDKMHDYSNGDRNHVFP